MRLPWSTTIGLVAALLAMRCGGGTVAPGGDAAPAVTTADASASRGSTAAAPATTAPATEARLRAELETWKGATYAERGSSKRAIGNAEFVAQVMRAALAQELPGSVEEQLRTGKLVGRDALAPGDLVFFEGKGFGPFKPKTVALFIGRDEVAVAHKDLGVVVRAMSGLTWDATFKTARRVIAVAAAPPVFSAASYGANRGALLREIAVAWSGTLYLTGGTTFDGIGNDEFVRSVYEAVYDTELEGEPDAWARMGVAVPRTSLEPGDIIIYDADGFGRFVKQRHAGIFIGQGEFVHAVRGSAVTISKMDDPRWAKPFREARRIDPEVLARQEEARAGPARTITAAKPGPVAPTAPPTETEQRLRAAIAPWEGTPYKIGGTSKSGIDCSAFVRAIVQEVYRVELPRTAEEQERLGAPVERRELVTGDLVFFRTKGMGPVFRSRHVGIYVGRGEFAQASGKRGVNIARLDDYYWNKKYATARRTKVGGN